MKPLRAGSWALLSGTSTAIPLIDNKLDLCSGPELLVLATCRYIHLEFLVVGLAGCLKQSLVVKSKLDITFLASDVAQDERELVEVQVAHAPGEHSQLNPVALLQLR